jgi:hypothetical protein
LRGLLWHPMGVHFAYDKCSAMGKAFPFVCIPLVDGESL